MVSFEPFFTFNTIEAQIVGAHMKFVELKAPKGDSVEWTFDINDLEAVLSPKTKMLVINSPTNPDR